MVSTKNKHQQINPWEQQPGETAAAYRAFQVWLETDPQESRNFVETYRQIRSKVEAKHALERKG